MLSVCFWPQGSNCSQFRGQRSHKEQFWLALMQLTAGVYRMCVCVSCVFGQMQNSRLDFICILQGFSSCLSRSAWRVTTVGAVNIYHSTPTQFMVLQDWGIQSVGSLLIFNWGGDDLKVGVKVYPNPHFESGGFSRRCIWMIAGILREHYRNTEEAVCLYDPVSSLWLHFAALCESESTL